MIQCVVVVVIMEQNMLARPIHSIARFFEDRENAHSC